MKSNKKNLLISSIDNKFLIEVINLLNNDFNVQIDIYNKTTIDRRIELLNWADIIFCEWCLVYSYWYSNYKKNNQKLFIRLHRYDLYTNCFDSMNWKNVDNLIFIAPEIKRLANKRNLQNKNIQIHDNSYVLCDEFKDFNGGQLIWNYVKSDMFLDLAKLENNEFNIGIMGILPKIKRPDIALDIIEHLIKKDKRYKLYILSQHYTQWFVTSKNEEEVKYYKNFEWRINNSNLKNHVFFEEHRPDVHIWFQKIGFLLSVSDIEGSHQAVAEAMATGTIPFIYGNALKEFKLDEVYPKKYCFYQDNVDKLCDKIYFYSNNLIEKNIISKRCKKYSYDNFRLDIIYKKMKSLLI